VKREFPKATIIEVENKSDLVKTESGRPRISAETGEGVPDIVEMILAALKARPQQRL
jgi:hypothetical protein